MCSNISVKEEGVLRYNNGISHLMSNYTRPLFDDFGITFFTVVKIFSNQVLHLTNHMKWTELYVMNKFYELNHYEHHLSNMGEKNSCTVFWNDNDSIIVKVVNELNIGNAVSIYKRYGAHIEMWSFATTVDNIDIINFYANNIALLERFIVYFKNRAYELLDTSNASKLLIRKNELILPGESAITRGQVEDFMEKTSLVKFKANGSFDVRISKREAECLYLLSQGKSAKEIALTLKISNRTVEWYFKQIKYKFKCNSKYELIKIFESNFKEYFKPELQ
jgi:DNA-binding CsgD family transcriptional regulator